MSQEKTPKDNGKKRSLSLADIETTVKLGRRSALSVIGGALAGTTGLASASRQTYAADADTKILADLEGNGTDNDKGANSDEIGAGSDADETHLADPTDTDIGDPAGEGSDTDSGAIEDLAGEGSDDDTGPERDPVGAGSDTDIGDPAKAGGAVQSDPIDMDSGIFADPADSD